MRNLIVVLLLFSIYTVEAQRIKYSPLSTCPYVLGEITEVKLQEEGFNHPKLSPDGTRMLLTKSYRGIYEVDLSNLKTIKTISEGDMDGFTMKWTGVGNEISFIRTSQNRKGGIKREYFKKDLLSKSISVVDITDFNTPIRSLKNLNDKLIIQNDLKTRKLIANNGEKVWDITPEIGFCYDVVQSPDKSKVVFSSHGTEYVYATNGSGIISALNAGLDKNWSPDGQYLLYFRDEQSDGDAITASDLFMCKADGSEHWKLTNTPEVLEVYPHWSANGTKITYYDEKTGKIYVANIYSKESKK